MNIKDLLPKLLSSIQQKAMRNEDSVSLGGGGGGGECFDIPTPVLLFPGVYGYMICYLWFLRACTRTLNFLSYVYM